MSSGFLRDTSIKEAKKQLFDMSKKSTKEGRHGETYVSENNLWKSLEIISEAVETLQKSSYHELLRLVG